MMEKKVFLIVILFVLIFGLTACSSLREIDNKIGQLLNGQTSSTSNKTFKVIDNSLLTKEQKAEIDLWLKTNGFNRYGDKKNTFYPSGTPLFNEQTGESLERYKYILEKHPDILSKI